jgi:hypothetical protein
MQRIHYSGTSLLTGDDIARAMLRYAQALTHSSGSAEITLPVRLSDGGTAQATLLIGPASQLVTVDEQSPFDELSAPELVDSWHQAAARLSSPPPDRASHGTVE